MLLSPVIFPLRKCVEGIPKVRGRWLDALYHFDEEFQFPPPLIGCGKYAICERHFAFGKYVKKFIAVTFLF